MVVRRQYVAMTIWWRDNTRLMRCGYVIIANVINLYVSTKGKLSELNAVYRNKPHLTPATPSQGGVNQIQGLRPCVFWENHSEVLGEMLWNMGSGSPTLHVWRKPWRGDSREVVEHGRRVGDSVFGKPHLAEARGPTLDGVYNRSNTFRSESLPLVDTRLAME